MAGKLKGFDIKKLALKHGEKGLLDVAGLLVAYALLAGTKWVPFGHHPKEITNKVKAAEHELQSKTWPDEEQQRFVVPEEKQVHNLVALIREPVDSAPYEFSQSFRFDLYGTTTPITEPEWYPVKSLVADAGRAVFYVNPDPLDEELLADDLELETGADGTETASSEEDDIPPEFRSANRSLRGPGGDGDDYERDLLGEGVPGRGRVSAQDRRRGDAARGRSRSGRRGSSRSRGAGGGNARGLLGGGRGFGFGSGGDEDEDAGDSGIGGDGYGGGVAGGAEGRGQRFVAVRGKFPLRDQIRKVKKAANVSYFEAEQLFQIIDFELQRKKMQEGADDPWGGDWEDVDIEVAKEVLTEAADFDAELLQGMVTDSAITMPLPMRAMGIWHDLATHPELKDFELSEEEIQLEMEMQERLLKEHLKMQEEMPEELVEKKGFSDFVHDGRSLTGSLRGGRGGLGFDDDNDTLDGGSGFGSGLGGGRGLKGRRSRFEDNDTVGYGVGGTFGRMYDPDKFLKEIEESTGDEERKQVLLKYVKEQIKQSGAGGEMLLFRYLDFDVEPGATYKYRVRLEVTNPNYGRRSSEAAGLAHVVEGQTRKTEWSNATEPVRVPDDVDYFVDEIQTRGSDRLYASWEIFEWDPEFGSTVANRDLEVELGEEIGGESKPYVLDPAKPRFELQDYEFQSGDIFIDAMHTGTISLKDHPDLTLARGARRNDLRISNQALVVRSNGSLKLIDQLSRKGQLERRRQRLKYEQLAFEDIKGIEAEQNRDTFADGFGGDEGDGVDAFGFGGGDEGGKGRGRGRRGRGRNSLRKGRGGPGSGT